MRKGDIVRCIENRGIYSVISLGKDYTIDDIEYDSSFGATFRFITVVGDDGARYTLSVERFKPLSELREDKLKELGL